MFTCFFQEPLDNLQNFSDLLPLLLLFFGGLSFLVLVYNDVVSGGKIIVLQPDKSMMELTMY